MTVCGGWSLLNLQRQPQRAITLFCRAWSCPDCMPRRLRALKHVAAEGNPTTFITLTVNPQRGETPEARARELTDAWRVVVKRARRKFRKAPLEFLAVFEETNRGEPHLHILCRAPYIPQSWLSAQMTELIEAPIVDIRSVHGKKGVARYVAKYVAKGPKSFGALKRYWMSGRYDLRPERPVKEKSIYGSPWNIRQVPLWLIAQHFEQQGDVIEWDGDNAFVITGRRRRVEASFNIPEWDTLSWS